jgi:putative ABC transport system substrate-binding protein
MRRREFITLLGGAVVWPLAARAQQPGKVLRIGFLGLEPASGYSPRVEGLRAGLREFGYVEGKNTVIEFRWAETADQLSDLATRLIGADVDIIFASSSIIVEPARQATRTIPIVFASHADPVGIGHVASLARPGGNITGLSAAHTDIAAKELQILKEAVPQVVRIGILWHPETPSHPPALKALEAAGQTLGVQLRMVPAGTVAEFGEAFATMTRENMGGFVVVASLPSYSRRTVLAELAMKHRLPGIFGLREHAEAGGLMSYGADTVDLHRRAAAYIDKIFRGAKPADLPVQQPTKFELVINLKTARALGLEVPPTLLARADEVIE